MSSVETGQMSAAETGQMSAVVTRRMLKSQTRSWASSSNGACPKPGQAQILADQSSSRGQNIKFGRKWVENRGFGLKLDPNESCGLSGPTQTTFWPKIRQNIAKNFDQPPGGGRYLVSWCHTLCLTPMILFSP